MGKLGFLDWFSIGIYFLLVFGTAFWVTRKSKGIRESSAGYFLAGRNVGWFVIGASLFASNIGSEHLVGLAGTGAASGVAVGHFEVLASLILLLLGWFFVPFYLSSGVFTMPEFLERRYSSGARWYLAVISVIGYVLTKISVTVAAGGIVFESVMGINFWTGALIVIVVTGVYTSFGGLRAVLYTDMLQMFVLIGGAVTVTAIGLIEVGGWSAIQETAGSDFFNMWRPATDPEFPWTGIVFGAPILGVWYWCTDQYIVQRVLSAHGQDAARRGTIFGSFLKLLPIFLFVIPGVIAHCLVVEGRMQMEKPDHALPALIGTLLPVGLRGVVVAGLLAALMSSLSSVFNSCSTLITWDIYRKFHPEASEKRLVFVGQISTVLLVISGLLWIPFMKNISGQLFYYIQSVSAYLSPPIAAVFLIGILWKRVNAHGAVAALATGFVLGMGRLIAEINKDSLGGVLLDYATVNFLHIAIILFLISSAVLVVVSLATPAPGAVKLAGLTLASRTEDETSPVDRSDLAWKRQDIFLSVVVVILAASIWLYFRG